MSDNCCKYAASLNSEKPRRFKLTRESEEFHLEEKINELATMMAPLYEKLVPQGRVAIFGFFYYLSFWKKHQNKIPKSGHYSKGMRIKLDTPMSRAVELAMTQLHQS